MPHDAVFFASLQMLDARDRLSAVTSAVVHCDGACEPNPGPGGWGLLIDTHTVHRIELCGADPETTNNRMEMMAAIVALTVLPAQCAITIVSDSQYLIKGATIWIVGWKKNGWRTSDKKPLKNVDLWQRLDATLQQRQVRWHWVKGHAGHDQNERADLLATMGLRQLVDAR